MSELGGRVSGGGMQGQQRPGSLGIPTQVKHSKYGRSTQVGEQQGLGIPTQTKAHKFAQMEEIVRPWADFAVVPSNPREPTVPSVVRPEAYIEWGATGTFEENDFREDAKNIGFRVDDDDEPERERYVFSEQGRRTSDWMVVGVEDPESYVVLRVVDQIAFDGPNGEQFRMRLTPHMPGTQTGSGQTPPSPPLEQM